LDISVDKLKMRSLVLVATAVVLLVGLLATQAVAQLGPDAEEEQVVRCSGVSGTCGEEEEDGTVGARFGQLPQDEEGEDKEGKGPEEAAPTASPFSAFPIVLNANVTIVDGHQGLRPPPRASSSFFFIF
jgi:hypothetical protein